jgi:predicted nucleic acid-binding protein
LSRYLLDTSVLSILAPGRPDATPEFLQWVAARDTELHVSTISIAEIEQGIAKLRRQGSTHRPALLSNWLRGMLTTFAERVIAFDAIAAHLAGEMGDKAAAEGFRAGTADLYIAATAKSLGCIVLTRNLKHFVPLGVDAIDPLVTLPD